MLRLKPRAMRLRYLLPAGTAYLPKPGDKMKTITFTRMNFGKGFLRCERGSLDLTTAIVSLLVVVSLAVSLNIYMTAGA